MAYGGGSAIHENPFTGRLVNLCIPSAPGMQRFFGHALELSPLATEFRYPGDVFEPTMDEAQRVLQLAVEITDWISEEFSKLAQP